MLGNLTGWHLLVLVLVILLLFGAAKLPALAKSMGQSARVFRGEMKAMKEEDSVAQPAADSTVADTHTDSSTAHRNDGSAPNNPTS
ncbi:Sec-independent protein translocase subunit TatA [Microbacterium tenebrionis]|uniref:Sec-independent protein translocase protein TatA n=1 Tax=Microbacterium tenebrionis TaxID=2830665 RepID=A0A9X1LN71_9MICO|nr:MULTISPECIES: Sec-independent protein translocase subunit TatA [Microbacterium]MCC2029032.1 Sec-independent protein translocase subunit TatA [Microbacterium tenebrionis]